MPTVTRPGTATSRTAAYAVPGDGTTPVPLWEPPPAVGLDVAEGLADGVRLALRLVVRLDLLHAPGPDGGARPEATQEGLAESLHVTQGAVSKVLARLMAVSIIMTERRHVRGRDRRVRVYYLSGPGRELARQIEQRFGIPPPPPG